MKRCQGSGGDTERREDIQDDIVVVTSDLGDITADLKEVLDGVQDLPIMFTHLKETLQTLTLLLQELLSLTSQQSK